MLRVSITLQEHEATFGREMLRMLWEHKPIREYLHSFFEFS